MNISQKFALSAFLSLALTALTGPICSSQEPTGTYMFAQRDTCELFMDYYAPASGSQTTLDGKKKPAVIFMFGGGFIEGSRNDPFYFPWFEMLTREGYRVFSIDYRLGLKGVKKMGIAQAGLLIDAINLAVEDLYSATAFLLENADEFGIEPDGLVVSGSSAGAISVMQAEYALANHSPLAQVLPEDFDYAGVMSFAGAIYSSDGVPSYKREPAPTLMLHGTADKLVPYKQIHFLRKHFAGTQKLTPVFAKGGFSYNTIRYEGHGHEISTAMSFTFPEQLRFLETNVIRKEKRILDALVIDDPIIPFPDWGNSDASDLYGKD